MQPKFLTLAAGAVLSTLAAAPLQAQDDANAKPRTEKKEGPGKGNERPANGGVPEDLLDDEHVQEEFGVSDMTTPSIKKIFQDLESLGNLPYDTLKRPIPKTTPGDRTLVALNLGLLIGDGFLSVQSEKISDIEDIGRAILKHGKVLGAGAKVAERTKSILENSALSDWKRLKEDLSGTQREVKHEMVLLRDIDMVHLISLGGWLRGLEIGSAASLSPFSADKAKVLARHDLAEYFIYVLDGLSEKVQALPHIQAIKGGLTEIDQIVNLPEGKPLTKDEVTRLQKKSADLVAIICPPGEADKDKSEKGDKPK